MKRFTCSALLAAAMLASARADLTIVQKIEGAGPMREMTMKIKGDKVRIEAMPEITSIYDGKTGEVVNIMNKQKMVMRMSAEQAKAAGSMAGNQIAQGQRPAEKVKLTPTGRRENINGHDAEEHVAETSSYKASYWIARSYPQADAIMKQLQATSSQAWDSGTMGMPDFRDFPGVPVRTNVSMGGQQYVTTITSVKLDPLPDSDFAVPPGYQEMKMPNLDALTGGKPTDPAPKAKASPKK